MPMKNLPVEFWLIAVFFLAGIIACIVSGTALGAIACALIGAAGLYAVIRRDRANK